MNTHDERLRDYLRGADPALGDSALTHEEVRAMRRAVLASVPEPRRRWIPTVALAGSALTALLLAITLLGPDPEGPAAPPRQPEPVAATSRPAPAPVEPVVIAEEPEKPQETPAPRRKPEPETAPVILAETTPEVTPEIPIEPEPAATIAAETRQIQFSTPGGTRIIWVLTSDGATY